MSWYSIVILLTFFIIFLIKAFIEDSNYIKQIELDIIKCPSCSKIEEYGGITDSKSFHNAVIETMSYENKYGRFADSKVKKILTSARDQIIRGIIMGAIDGTAIGALQGAVTWSLSGGIVTGLGDLFRWKTKFL